MDRKSDERILLLIRQQDTLEDGFELLINEYQKELYFRIRRMVVSHHDTHDILQEVFLKVWRNIQGFEGRAALSSWLYRIAINEAMTFLAKKKRKPYLLSDNLETHSSQAIDGKKAESLLLKAVAMLPERQRQVFDLRYFEAMSYQEMASILNISEGALKASYHHAVKKIEAFIKEHTD